MGRFKRVCLKRNRKFNNKFFGKNENDLTWKYWFFPVINTDKTLQQIDRIIADSKHQLSDEKMAEIYSQCAVHAFNRKDYTECKKLLYRIIDSQAHIEYISSAKLELAYIFRMEGNFGEETSLLKSIINNPSSPSEIRIKAEKLLEQYEK